MIYTNYEKDDNGEYTYFLGKPTNSAVPPQIEQIVVPAGKYLIFTSRGELPEVYLDAWVAVWQFFKQNTHYKRTYTGDVETQISPDEVELYIAVL